MKMRKSIPKIFLGIGGLLLVITSILAWSHLTYYGELNFIKKALVSIPGVVVRNANGNHDVSLEDIWAEIDIEGKGPMDFAGLTEASFTSGSGILVRRISNVYPRTITYGYDSMYDSTGKLVKSEAYSSFVQINGDSVFSPLFPSGIKTVRDAVLHYDGILQVLSQWPKCPDVSRTTDSKGTEYCYCVANDDRNLFWPPGCKER